MEFLDLIGTILDYTQKGEEFSDEIKTIKATLHSLQLTIQEVGQDHLPLHLSDMLQENLSDAEGLLSKTSQKTNWWKNIKNMLPGSDLHKLKDKNVQLQQCINLLNLHLNANKIRFNGKRKALSEPYLLEHDEDIKEDVARALKKIKTMNIESRYSDDASTTTTKNYKSSNSGDFQHSKTVIHDGTTKEDLELMATLVDTHRVDVNAPTQKENENFEEEKVSSAFELRFIYDDKIGARIRNHPEFKPIVRVPWNDKDEVDYVIKRVDCVYLPGDNPAKISREHCKIAAKRAPVQQKPAQDLQGPTLIDNDESHTSYSDLVSYELIDLSTNGTFYIKKNDHNVNEFNLAGMTIKGEFVAMAKGQKIPLEEGDIVCLIIKRSTLQELIFGFQFIAGDV